MWNRVQAQDALSLLVLHRMPEDLVRRDVLAQEGEAHVKAREKIERMMKRAGEIETATIAKRLNMSGQAVRFHLQRIVKQGLATRKGKQSGKALWIWNGPTQRAARKAPLKAQRSYVIEMQEAMPEAHAYADLGMALSRAIRQAVRAELRRMLDVEEA